MSKENNSSKNSKKENYLDRIPVICEDRPWELKEDGIVEITVENVGFYNKLAQKVFKKPRYSFIKLDAHGSKVWQLIDGERTIYQIGQILKKEDKEAKNQLYERLSKFMATLETNRFIRFKEKE